MQQCQPALKRFLHGYDAGEDIGFPFLHSLHEPVPRRRGIQKLREVIGVENGEHGLLSQVFLLAPFRAEARRLTQQRLIFQRSEGRAPFRRGLGRCCIFQTPDALFEVRQFRFDGGAVYGRMVPDSLGNATSPEREIALRSNYQAINIPSPQQMGRSATSRSAIH